MYISAAQVEQKQELSKVLLVNPVDLMSLYLIATLFLAPLPLCHRLSSASNTAVASKIGQLQGYDAIMMMVRL
jgi:hypothetical protein